ncbi:hypothetical protein [Chryseobacterium sp. 'Rf worker isolate 10']|uniref:hypothetical protein n=1 Tax=Chryseobacterium sp. 'Rf worker isolate 10' TaxID=2887348 RepID=UPI003D6DB6AD
MKVQKFNFDTQYNQFYISSVGKDFNADEKKDMSSFTEDMNRRLGIEKNALIVFTESYGKIRGDIQVLENASINSDYRNYDHIVEGSINIESGVLQLLDSPHSHIELSINVDPGRYKVRVYSSNLSSVKETDLPHSTDKDYYHIELWKNDNMETKVIKQYKEQ